MTKIDVLVIGSGTAGQTAAHDLAGGGMKVALVEASAMPGGVCALRGCQAKKWFYEVSELVARSRHLQGLGVVSPPQVDWGAIRAAKNRFTAQIPAGTVAGLKGSGVLYLEGQARFVGKDAVAVSDAILKPDYVVIATGASPAPLPFKGSDLLMSSDAFLDLDQLPPRICFIGGGFISFEFAHFAARLRAQAGEVHILEVQERPLMQFDADLVQQLLRSGSEDGVNVHCGVDITAVSRTDQGYRVSLGSGPDLDADLVVHGAGRIANIADLGLEAAGIDHDRRGILVDEVMRTSNPQVFAVGDCAATIQLARVADAEAHTAAQAILASMEGEEQPAAIEYSAIPSVLFTYPQLAMVGATEQTLQDQGIRYWKAAEQEVGWPTYRRVGMKHAAYKILVDGDSRILGAHVLADQATGLINTFRHAMLAGLTVPELYRSSIVTPYPSRESDILYMLAALLD